VSSARRRDIDAVDAIDVELFRLFEEEAEELLPQLRRTAVVGATGQHECSYGGSPGTRSGGKCPLLAFCRRDGSRLSLTLNTWGRITKRELDPCWVGLMQCRPRLLGVTRTGLRPKSALTHKFQIHRSSPHPACRHPSEPLQPDSTQLPFT
jgi:hypothetical protein